MKFFILQVVQQISINQLIHYFEKAIGLKLNNFISRNTILLEFFNFFFN